VKEAQKNPETADGVIGEVLGKYGFFQGAQSQGDG
jgi:hypothetical protein